jgi:hypothetical protein
MFMAWVEWWEQTMDWPWDPLHASRHGSFCGSYKSYHRKWKESYLLGGTMAQRNAAKRRGRTSTS